MKDYNDKYESVIKHISEYKLGQTFEDVIIERFSKYYGFSEKEISKIFNLKNSTKRKNAVSSRTDKNLNIFESTFHHYQNSF